MQPLFPYPGSKRRRCYHNILNPQPGATGICEPFAGSCATSLRLELPQVYLGEVNPSIRRIYSMDSDFVASYRAQADFYRSLTEWQDKTESRQQVFRPRYPELSAQLDCRWKFDLADLLTGGDWANPLFMIRAAFGNILRLNPTGTAYNVSWHCEKLRRAILSKVEPLGWNPIISNDYVEAICSIPEDKVDRTYMLLDPPYLQPEGTKMTPCYPGHAPSRESTRQLAIGSLDLALSRGFPKVSLCNYWDSSLEDQIKEMCTLGGYRVEMQLLGTMDCFNTAKGRLVHGQRVDKKPKPIEAIWTIVNKYYKSVVSIPAG
jgi:site-specific DNA-adenine methylase